MARLACESKMAFYPTSLKTVEKVKALLQFAEGAQICDPCCGEAEALNVFKACGKTYGIELDSIRAQKAASKVDSLLNADALGGVRRSLNWASFLFLNPPYGVDSLQKRLEQRFIDVWANTVATGGYMLLVINPSSATMEMAKAIRLANYKPIVSFYDEASEDYHNYDQYCMLFQRQNQLYKHDIEKMFEFMEFKNAVDINSIEDKFEVPAGRVPDLFKEVTFPDWKLDGLLSKSNIIGDFEKELLTATVGFGSIETLNEGQRQFLTASGAIDEPIKEGPDDKGLILKGTVKKVTSARSESKDGGESYSCKVSDNFVTEVYGLNLNTLTFYRYT